VCVYTYVCIYNTDVPTIYDLPLYTNTVFRSRGRRSATTYTNITHAVVVYQYYITRMSSIPITRLGVYMYYIMSSPIIL